MLVLCILFSVVYVEFFVFDLVCKFVNTTFCFPNYIKFTLYIRLIKLQLYLTIFTSWVLLLPDSLVELGPNKTLSYTLSSNKLQRMTDTKVKK